MLIFIVFKLARALYLFREWTFQRVENENEWKLAEILIIKGKKDRRIRKGSMSEKGRKITERKLKEKKDKST